MVIDVGQVLDKYELLERVGQGGMAIVYRGRDRSLKRDVAVKVLHRHLADHQEARDRFEREAHAVAKLRHENILEIFDYSGKSADESYIVTEFIEGQTLKQFITDHPPQHPEIGAMIVVQICRALAHAHAQGILHRDVKPENVMIRGDGVVKLMDFGISQMIDTQRLTVTGQLLGSPAYMSPEHVEGKPLDVRTDVFACGIVLYQLTVGALPFSGKNPHEILKRIAECKFPDPRHGNPRIGNELGRIILRAMAREPDERYRDMGELLAALERYIDGSGLGTSKDELARYFQAPAPYEMALKARLCDHLLRRARALLSARAGAPGGQPAAIELLDRILAIEPTHPQVIELLDGLGRRRRTRTYVAVAAGVVAVAGAAWLVRGALLGGGGAAAPDATTIALAPVDAGAPVMPDAALAPLLDAAVVVAATADARPAEPERPDARVREPVDGSAIRPRAPDAGVARAPDAGAPAIVVARVQVSPSDSEVKVGDGGWRRLPGGADDVDVPPAGIRVAVRNDACCEPTERVIAPTDAGETVQINLGYLPGQVIARCPEAGVKVTVDGRAATLGVPALIPFEDSTLSTRSVKVEFVHETLGIDPHAVTVRPNRPTEVACKFD